MGVEEIAKKKVEFGLFYSLDELTEIGLTPTKPDQYGNPGFESDSTIFYFVKKDDKYRPSHGLGKVSTSIFNSTVEDD